jgi:hypothetical protein
MDSITTLFLVIMVPAFLAGCMLTYMVIDTFRFFKE